MGSKPQPVLADERHPEDRRQAGQDGYQMQEGPHSVIVETDESGRSDVHPLGEASAGIGKLVTKHSRLLILYTGGTMGMKPDASGALAPVPGYLTQQIQDLMTLHENDPLPTVEVKEYGTLIDSCDMGPEHWRVIAEDILSHYNDFDGFVVIMGTDTMAYSASALSFMLENLGKTVIFTGSQIPYCKTFSDARRNLLFSISLATTLDIPEVCLFFDDKLLRGCRSRKADSGSFSAFQSPNHPPLATLGLSININTSHLLPQPKGRFRVHLDMSAQVVVLKLVPQFDTAALVRLAKHGLPTCKAVVLELYGTGNAPHFNREFLEAMDIAKKNGLVVVATSQCARGSVIPATKALTSWLDTIGIVPAHDMTSEATCAKLAYLFGKNLTPQQVAAAMVVSLRGEITALSSSLSKAELKLGARGPQSRL